MALTDFHPAVAGWFRDTFDGPTDCQRAAWPAIRDHRHTLIAAPTGSGKTFAAFLAAIDELVHEGQAGELPDETRVLYVSPLKALSNDIQKNLQDPLEGISRRLLEQDLTNVVIRAMVRTGDTPAYARTAMTRQPPHILVTTPESLYILLTSEGGRQTLSTVRTVIVDEIHAVAGSKRGAHLALSLERLEALAGRALVRIGLSATQRPIEAIARFLTGQSPDGPPPCTVIDTGHVRDRDLAVELTDSPLEAVMSGETWGEVYDRLAALIESHRTTLVFVNTRRMAERVARHLSERIGEEHVTSHHGSLSREQRLHAEKRLKEGKLKALVATASLELGIDIGDVDLVCQLGSTRSISAFLQRVGRSGHAVGGLPKGRLFPLSRDDLVECAALLDAVRRGELDRLVFPARPLDVLAQQMVAMVACEEWSEDELYARVRRAWPYRDLDRTRFDAAVRMLADGFSTRRGRSGNYLHRDAVNRRLRPRRGARLTAITNGGAIPDTADYNVVLEPEGVVVGTLNEDFAIESLPGDIFQLGNNAWKILRIEAGRVRVQDAHGQPPNIPFWFGEAPGRTDEHSVAVSRLREDIDARLDCDAHGVASRNGLEQTRQWLSTELGLQASAAAQLVDYLGAARAALGVMPSRGDLVLERFFDESGGMQLVLHCPRGSRLNRAWGLALRKRFCRTFNFELQAAATEDAIIISLGETHSFPLQEVARYVHSSSARDVLIQALLDAPMFTVRWRWNANVALAIPRFRGGKKVPPQLQRMQAEDLVAVVFPDQKACFENIRGDREIPDHPLVNQTIEDCLVDAMDIDGLEAFLKELESGAVRVHARDLTEPSPLATEILSARPYSFLDDAPLEERRTQAVQARRWLDPQTASDLGTLDAQAIQRVREEAWPVAATPDELHDALMLTGFITAQEAVPGLDDGPWTPLMNTLKTDGRAAVLRTRPGGAALWTAAERLPQLRVLYPAPILSPEITAPDEYANPPWSRDDALKEILRGRLDALGPVTPAALARAADLSVPDVDLALIALESEGFAMRGQFTPGAQSTEWCERRLLARIHRYTVQRLRKEIEPVSARDFLRFLLDWQHATARVEGPQALASVLDQLEGFEAPAAAWESEILPARMDDYEPGWLDTLCLSGRYAWARISAGNTTRNGDTHSGPIRTTPIALLRRKGMGSWFAVAAKPAPGETSLSAPTSRLLAHLQQAGASFFDDLVHDTGLLATQVEQGLGELVSLGSVTSDSYGGLRALLVPSQKRRPLSGGGRRRQTVAFGIEDAGRWTCLQREVLNDAEQQLHASNAVPGQHDQHVEYVARALLRRYGVVFKRLLTQETALPPWRELLYVYRRLEARGEIRGGRFVAGFAGEQYALPEAIGALRKMRNRPGDGAPVSITAADPLNLVGILTPGARVPALTTNRVLYRDGTPVAVQVGKDVKLLEEMDPSAEWDTRNAVIRRRIPPALRPYLGNPQ